MLYGPIVLAGKLGTNDLPNPYVTNQTEYATGPPRGASFCRQPGYLLKHVKATGQPLAFRTENLGQPRM